MTLVNIGGGYPWYVNMDYILNVMHIYTNEFHIKLINGDTIKISKEAYDTILKYGKAEI